MFDLKLNEPIEIKILWILIAIIISYSLIAIFSTIKKLNWYDAIPYTVSIAGLISFFGFIWTFPTLPLWAPIVFACYVVSVTMFIIGGGNFSQFIRLWQFFRRIAGKIRGYWVAKKSDF